MANIILTGFMGGGKTAVGKRLAEITGREVIDTDDLIEEDAGMSISEIFEKFGEPHFRELEKKAVARASALESHIIVTGGGVVLKKENVENLRKNGTIVYLHAPPEVLYERIKDETHRPLLQVDDPLGKIRGLLEHRTPFYADNDFTIGTSNMSVKEVAEEIVRTVLE
ncbi:MAG: shikimate kinase [Candidatus Hydrothermarchaeaceae archaeon]